MLTLSLALLALLLDDGLIRIVTVTPAATVASATPPCPLNFWRGPCAYMNADQKAQIRRAVERHARVKAGHCEAAKQALFEWLDDGAWVFETHASDDPVRGSYVAGQTARIRGTKLPTGFGLRAAVFGDKDTQMLARIALHEGAHLAGEDEEGAVLVDSGCTMAG
jgi:hypothetical protein